MPAQNHRAVACALFLLTTVAAQAQPVPPAPPVPPVPPLLPVLPRPAVPAEPAAAPRALDLKAPARPPLPAREGASVRVEHFTVSGNTRVSDDEIATVLASFEQRTLSFAELSAAADAVTTLYRRRGWLLALAYLPEQQIRDGAVEIVVLEGRLGGLALGSAPPGIDRPLATSVAQWDIAGGDVIGEANLVRNLLVLGDWAGLTVGAEVRPGRQVGTADVTVDLRETGPRTAASVALDNLGSQATGRVRVGASASVREFAGRGDVFSAQALAGVEGGLASLAASYAFTLHPSGTRLGVSISHLRYELVDPAFDTLDAKGEATYMQLTLEQPIVRRVGDAVTLRAGIVGKRLRDRIDAFERHEDRHIGEWQLGLHGEHGGAGAPATNWSIGVTAGQVGFDDAVALAADSVLRQTAGRFGRFNLDVAHERPVSDRLALLARLVWQYALHRNLDSAERSVLGGAGALRPYGELSTQADQAVQVSLEARYRLSMGSVPVTASAFVDLGNGRADLTPAPGDNGIRSRLVGLGAEAQLPGELTLRVAATRQNVDPAPVGAPAWATRGWVELVKAF